MKNLKYYKNNCEEDYIRTPISVLRYIDELEKRIAPYNKPQIIDDLKAKRGNQLAVESDPAEYWVNTGIDLCIEYLKYNLPDIIKSNKE